MKYKVTIWENSKFCKIYSDSQHEPPEECLVTRIVEAESKVAATRKMIPEERRGIYQLYEIEEV